MEECEVYLHVRLDTLPVFVEFAPAAECWKCLTCKANNSAAFLAEINTLHEKKDAYTNAIRPFEYFVTCEEVINKLIYYIVKCLTFNEPSINNSKYSHPAHQSAT